MAKVSMREVAAHAGVSVGTVSHVLNHPEKVSLGTVEKVTRSIEVLGFVRNAAARQLRSGRSSSVGLLVLDSANPFFASVARGARAACDAAGMSMLLGDSGTDENRETRYLDLFAENRVNGILVTPAGADMSKFENVAERGTPILLVDHEADGSQLSSVTVDNVAGGRAALAHLAAGGCRRPAFVGGPMTLPQVSERLRGARECADELGLELTFFTTSELTVLAGREVGEKVLEQDPPRRPDAIFCANDLLAVGMMQALVMSGKVRVPDEIALIGYDDIDFAASTIVPLTSVRQPAELIGRTAVERLLGAGSGGVTEISDEKFTPELIVRESTRRS